MKVRMRSLGSILSSIAILTLLPAPARGQAADYRPVTTEMLENPDPADWLWFSRTPDAQRYRGRLRVAGLGRISRRWSSRSVGDAARTRRPPGGRRRKTKKRPKRTTSEFA